MLKRQMLKLFDPPYRPKNIFKLPEKVNSSIFYLVGIESPRKITSTPYLVIPVLSVDM